MKKIILYLLLSSILFAHEINEENENTQYGYSYLAIGTQNTFYNQIFNSQDGDYTLSSTSSSPYYTTATLTRVNELIGFEIYAASTLFATTTTEDVTATNLNATHKLDFTMTDIALTIHYKPINEYNRITLGARYTYEVLKRYDFREESSVSVDMVENRIASISLDVGYLYTSKIYTGTKGYHYRIGISVGVPFYAITADTYPPESFEMGSSWGYKFNATSYLGYTIYKGLEIGAYADAMHRVRFDQIHYEDATGTTITSKNSNMTTLNYGLMASWSF